MANHVRKQLRDAVTTRVTNLTTTSTRVHGHRADPLQISGLPALTIHTPGDEAEVQTIHAPITYGRATRVTVTGVAAAAANAETTLDDVLDTIAKEVEIALGTALTVDGKSVLLVYLGTTIEEKEAGEKTVATIEIEFAAKLYTEGTTPDVLRGGG